MSQLSQNELKTLAAKQALTHVRPNEVLGIGSGSTVNIFISLLPTLPFKVKAVVCASAASEAKCRELGFEVLTANDVESIGVYVDGADEVTPEGYMTKGGGAALTREKILAALSQQFVLIVDESKLVNKLGETFPLPVEVIPMARNQVTRHLRSLGANPQYRQGVVTDNHCDLIDCRDFVIDDALAMEAALNNVAGVVSNGIFAKNPAHVIIVAKQSGIESYEPTNK